MAFRTHIAIAEPSVIIRKGLLSVIGAANNNIMLSEIESIPNLKDKIIEIQPDILIINPLHLGHGSPEELKDENLKIIALQTALTDPKTLNLYDGVISVYESSEKIQENLIQVVNSKNQENDKKNELSSREKEIVVCVTKGMTNKEIADHLFLSTHTVIAHRRNISNKLEIHSSSGLTIYAILNKLIDIDSFPIK